MTISNTLGSEQKDKDMRALCEPWWRLPWCDPSLLWAVYAGNWKWRNITDLLYDYLWVISWFRDSGKRDGVMAGWEERVGSSIRRMMWPWQQRRRSTSKEISANNVCFHSMRKCTQTTCRYVNTRREGAGKELFAPLVIDQRMIPSSLYPRPPRRK